MKQIKKRSLRPTPALVVAFVALFAAMGGFGYAAVKLQPASVKTKNIRTGAVTTDKLADGAVTTPKFCARRSGAQRGKRDECRERGEAGWGRARRLSGRLAQGLGGG